MEELTDMMASSGAIGNSADSTKLMNYRSAQYKAKSSLDQRRRRDKLLDLQKGHRKDVLNKLRQIDDDDWQVFNSGWLNEGESMDTESEGSSSSKNRNTNPQIYKDQLMLSEWMIDIPSDFETHWIMVPSPIGRRCLVVAKNGTTYMYSKAGYCFNRFPSKLPGGCRYTNQGAGTTLLDCIFNEVEKTFYVLDVMCWNGHPVIDSETDFRFFWMNSKLQECPDIQSYSKINPLLFVMTKNNILTINQDVTGWFVFYQLPPFECKKETLQQAMVHDFHFKVDGVLFYHRQAHYLCGSTPLVVWLKPFMLPEVLGVDINKRYKEDVPSSYTGYESHLSLVQSDTTIAQTHQDLYSSPNGKQSKAERLIKQQAKSNSTTDGHSILREAQLKNTQTNIRNIQLGLDVKGDNSDISSTKENKREDKTRFKFGDAPSLSLGQPSSSLGSAVLSGDLLPQSDPIGMRDTTPTVPPSSPAAQNDTESQQSANQWNQYR